MWILCEKCIFFEKKKKKSFTFWSRAQSYAVTPLARIDTCVPYKILITEMRASYNTSVLSEFCTNKWEKRDFFFEIFVFTPQYHTINVCMKTLQQLFHVNINIRARMKKWVKKKKTRTRNVIKYRPARVIIRDCG